MLIVCVRTIDTSYDSNTFLWFLLVKWQNCCVDWQAVPEMYNINVGDMVKTNFWHEYACHSWKGLMVYLSVNICGMLTLIEK